MRTVVVGAGIIGASIAWSLARAGRDVVIISGRQPAATGASFGWINASFYADEAHHRLRVAGLAAYERMTEALPLAPVSPCGALWWEEQGAALRKMQTDLEGLGYPVTYVEDPSAVEPDVRGLPPEALLFPDEAAAEASALAEQLIKAAQALGAKVVSGVDVTGLLRDGGLVCGVETSIGAIEGTRVVIAAGNGAPKILESVGVCLPMLKRPGVMITTQPVAAKINHVLVTPHGEVRQLPDGRLLASAVANHQGDDASEVSETAEAIAARVLNWLDPMIGGEAVHWDHVMLAYRPVPQDGLPVIGAVGPDGLHVAVMHSGVTLAAIVGEAVAAEVLGQGGYDDLLAPYRPQRFQ